MAARPFHRESTG